MRIGIGVLLGVALSVVAGGSAHARDLEEVRVFSAASDGHADEIRIPSVARAPNGNLLAFAERRIFRGQHHDRCDIDIVVKRSTDGGRSWPHMNTLDGTRDLTFEGVSYNRYNSYHNPVPVVDELNGRVYVFYNLSFADDEDPGNIGPVIKSRILYRYSDDNGVSWSGRRDVTESLTPSDAENSSFNHHFGPGHGVTVEVAGTVRLVVPFRYQRTNGARYVGFIYKQVAPSSSEWKIARHYFRNSAYNANEVVVETLADGENLYFNMRDQAGNGYRLAHVLDNRSMDTDWWDEPRTWQPTQERMLIEPRCHASVLRAQSRFEGDAEDLLLFANPASKTDRRFLTIRRSLSETDTSVRWSENKLLTSRKSAYSDMVKIDGSYNGVLYETGDGNAYEEIVFTRFSNSWVKSARIANWDFGGLGTAILSAGSVIENREALAFDGRVAGRLKAFSGKMGFGGTSWKYPWESYAPGHIEVRDSDTNGNFDFDDDETFEIQARIRTYTHDSGGASGSGAILAKDSGGSGPEWWLRVRDNRIQFYVSDGTRGRGVYSTSSIPISDNQWHTIKARRDGETNRISVTVDGVTTSTTDGTTGLRNGYNVRIGDFNRSSRQFRGDMDYVRVYFYK